MLAEKKNLYVRECGAKHGSNESNELNEKKRKESKEGD